MYDFDTVIDRRNTNSLKWDIKENELPMWVADMDFKAAPEIMEAMRKRLDHGVFGYSIIPEEWEKAYVNWWKTRHGFEFKGSDLTFCTGVIPAISSCVRKLTTANENVLIQTPVYNIFFNCIINNGRRVLESPLVYENGEYRIDFEDLEKKLADPQTTLMLLCNPHNPIGKIWNVETLSRIGELCFKHHVTVISDEIHCDITEPGVNYVPFASVSEHCRDISVTAISPTKAFNLAGLQSAAVMASNPNLHHKVWRALNTDEVAEPNSFAVPATVAAFEQGGPWLDELRAYIHKNRQLATAFLSDNLPQIHVVPSQATYLLWVDCSAFTSDSDKFTEMIRKKTGLFVSSGASYGESGRCFLRLNIAAPKATVLEGLNRLASALK
ncbi:MAG: MalY/PatB family protein [Spirochaetales bacterium]